MELRDPSLSSSLDWHARWPAIATWMLVNRRACVVVWWALNLRLTEILEAIGYCCASCNLADLTSVSISRLGRFEYLRGRGVGCRDEKMVENKASLAMYNSFITKWWTPELWSPQNFDDCVTEGIQMTQNFGNRLYLRHQLKFVNDRTYSTASFEWR